MRSLKCLFLATALLPAFPGTPAPHRFAAQGPAFLLDGKPFLVRSGELHYPRIPRAEWRDRLRKARALGLNTVCTYVFWNLHEEEPGRFDFTGQNDVAAFLRMAQEEGLWVILRPGPYVCTEWDFGGLPAWLLREKDLKVRSADPRFLQAAERYLARVGRELGGLQCTKGGPILMVQVENEYGSFGRDAAYKEAIRGMIRRAGFEVQLFTSDGPDRELLAGGTLPEVPPVVNFGQAPEAQEAFEALEAFRPGTPRMVGEYWCGWFDHWGRPHHTTSAEEGAKGLEWLLSRGIGANLYMFHGGTNFGFWNGANADGGRYWPDTTSYDYDGLLDEAGRVTPKYEAYRAVLARHLAPGETLPPVPAPAPTLAIPRFAFREEAGLEPLLARPAQADAPLPMEGLGQSRGFVLYRHVPSRPLAGVLEVKELRDFAVAMQAGRRLGTLERRLKQSCLDVRLEAGQPLDLLVENQGRINFAQAMVEERKGILGPVTLADQALKGWQCFPLPLEDLGALRFGSAPVPGPAFHRATFQVAEPAATFLDMRGWGKGVAWVNGHCLGRYWGLGPQQSLHCPASWLRKGNNEMVVFELLDPGPRSVQGLQDPVFGAGK